MLHSANYDPELRNWLDFQSEQESNFFRSLADTAKMADAGQYAILRPAMIMLRAQSPEPGAVVEGGIPRQAGENQCVENFEREDVRHHRFGSIEAIRDDGFDGFVAVSTLRNMECGHVPEASGVYYVLQRHGTPPDFLELSTAGNFNDKNPTVPVSVLRDKWVQGAIVLKISKAGLDEGRTLKKRLKEYMRFGRGISVDHWGGRYIWQLDQSADLLVCWKLTTNADQQKIEEELIREFKAAYGKIPFANIQD